MIAEVVVDVMAKQVNRCFDYLVPEHLESIIKVGYRVKVIFGNRVVTGFVVGLKNSTSFKKKLKAISDVVDVYPVLNEEFVDIAKFIASNNFSYYATALQTMIPTALKIKYQKLARVEKCPEELKDIFKDHKEIILDNRTKEELNLIYKAVQDGLVTLDTKIKKNRNEKTISYVYVIDETIEPASRQGKALLQYLLELGSDIAIDVLVEDSGFSKNVINTLIKKGILGVYQQEVLSYDELVVKENNTYTFTADQRKVYEGIELNKARTYLLHGVTGSGKTLVYMQWIEDVLKQNKQALMLVPEISLTPQITALFKKRFGSDVAILHSRLSISEKYNSWKKILNKKVNIVVGARSAIFSPLSNLGIIIIDEEHESSYVQDNNPRYNALEIAALRSERHKCPLILGSATPNINDYYKAINGDYTLLELPKRVNNLAMPKKTIVDMTLELKRGNKSVFSNVLRDKIISNYKNDDQTILFLNRRGFASFVMCRNCGEVIKCPHCDVSLTYHASSNTLKCHYCGYSQMNVVSCPNCQSDKIRFVGSGTEKIMTTLNELIPEAKVLRVDLDTIKKVSDYEEAFAKFKNHEADILVGTQMIAKGLDFEDVTLVGIVNADLSLNYPSYDANMTAFNLIEQVSGRAGRGKKAGEVIIQTYKPSHFVIQAAYLNDYDQFFKKELELRRVTSMPPFSLCIAVVIQSKNQQRAYEEALNVIYALKSSAKATEILGPAEGLPFKLNDVYRYTIQLKIIEDEVLAKLKEIYPFYQNNKEIDLKIIRM